MVPASAMWAPSQMSATTNAPGQQHLQGVEDRLRPGHLDAAATRLLRLRAVAAGEDLLAADAAQDPQAGDGVRAERGQPARRLALRRLPAGQRLDEQAEDRGDRRQAEDDDEPERHGDAQHEHRDDAVGDEAAEEVGGEREDLADAQRVVGDGRDDLARRQLLGDRVARPGDRAADQLRGRERRPQPVVDVVPVADGRRRDDHRAERQQRAARAPEVRAEAVSSPSSIARPTTYGVNAWAANCRMPSPTAVRRMPHCRRASHQSSAVGPLRGGVPGSSRGRERTRSNVTGRYRQPQRNSRPATPSSAAGDRRLSTAGSLVRVHGHRRAPTTLAA